MRVEYLAGLVSAIADNPLVGRVLIEPAGPYLDDGRNLVVQNFLNSTHLEYLLFIDSDIYFTNEHITKIYDLAKRVDGIVSGAYRTQRANGSYVVAGDRDPSTGVFELFTLDEFEQLPHPTEVDGVGAGFLMIPRHILVELRDAHGSPCPWFHEPIDEHGVHLGEDYGFCDRVTKAGYPIYLDPSIRLTHIKSIGLTL